MKPPLSDAQLHKHMGQPGASYASSYGFSAFKGADGKPLMGTHMNGLENVSVKKHLKAQLAKRGGSCDKYHSEGACPRYTIFGCQERPQKKRPPGA